MWILLWALSPAHACSCSDTPYRTVTLPQGDGVPTNPRLYGFVSFDQEQVHVRDHSVGAGVIGPDGDEVAAAFVEFRPAVDGGVIVADLERELEPYTRYEVFVWGDWDDGYMPPSTFTTGAGPDHEAPDAPELWRVAHGGRPGGTCGEGKHHVTVGVNVEEGEMVTLQGDNSEWMLLPGTTSYDSTFCRPTSVPRDAASVFIEDAAGNRSEVSRRVRVARSMCGCATTGGAAQMTWAAMLLGLFGVRRRSAHTRS